MSLKFKEHRYIYAFTILIFVAVIVCILCNIAINHHMSWLVYPVLSLLFGWGVLMPLIYRGKDGVLHSLGLFSALILPYLLILEQWTSSVRWFISIAFPITFSVILLIWIAYFIQKFGKYIWKKLSLLVLIGGILSLLLNLYLIFVSKICQFPWGWISLGSAVLVSGLILLAGRIRVRENKCK